VTQRVLAARVVTVEPAESFSDGWRWAMLILSAALRG
jgi:hypothetical protein